MTTPDNPKIYHITHVRNLRAIAGEGALISDQEMVARGGPEQPIGMSAIKARRIHELEVSCHAGTKVGDYVPFYFCPRSVMLYVISCRNHLELTYRDGQGPIVHLQADLRAVVRWAQEHDVRWAFSLSNAGAYYTEFRNRVEDLEHLSWDAIRATDFRTAAIKEGKQAEFLVHGRFPFTLVERIGVRSEAIRRQAETALSPSGHRPVVEVKPAWYY